MAKNTLKRHLLKAIILVAGRGYRLRPLTDTMPKSLIKIYDKPLLWYSIANLVSIGIDEIVFVVGHHASMVKRFVHEFFPVLRCTFIYNNQYATKNSIFSFYKARGAIRNCNFFRLAGDLLYSKAILELLLYSKKPIISAVEKKNRESQEEFSVSVNVKKGTIIEYGKHLPFNQSYGEAQGIDFVTYEYAQVVKKSLEEIILSGQTHEFPEYAFQHLINQGLKVFYQDIHPNNFWCEIDNTLDLQYAIDNFYRIR